MTVEAARVGHQDPEQRCFDPGSGTQISDVEGPESSGLSGVTKPRRQTFAIIGGEGHQDLKLLLQLLIVQHVTSWMRCHATRR
jgi:hypothetical protein